MVNRKNRTFDNSIIALEDNIHFRARFATVILVVTWFYSYWYTIFSIFLTYKYFPENRYGILILPFIIYLFVSRSKEQNTLSPACSQIGLVLLFFINIAWAINYVNNNTILQQVFSILMLPAIIYTTEGPRIGKKFFSPMMMLLCLIPVSQIITPIVQENIGMLIAKFIGNNTEVIYKSKTVLSTKYYTFNVADATYALKYAAGSAAILFCYICVRLQGYIERIVSTFFVLLLPILFNLLGAILILKVGFAESNLDLSNLFRNYSWIFFISAIIVNVLIVEKLNIKNSTIRIVSENSYFGNISFANYKWFKTTVISFCVLLMIPWLASNVKDTPWKNKGQLDLKPPRNIMTWDGPRAVYNSLWEPKFTEASKTIFYKYMKFQDEIQIYSSLYEDVLYNHGLFNLNNRLYNKYLWQSESKISRNIKIDNGEEFTLTEEIINYKSTRKIIWYWYYIGNNVASNLELAKLLETLRLVTNSTDHSGVVILGIDFIDNEDHARTMLNDFFNKFYSQIKFVMYPIRIEKEALYD